MVQLYYKCILVLVVTPLLFAMSVFAQANQTANQAAQIQSNTLASNNERSQKKQVAAIFNKRIADKKLFWAKDPKPLTPTNGNDAGQEKPARLTMWRNSPKNSLILSLQRTPSADLLRSMPSYGRLQGI